MKSLIAAAPMLAACTMCPGISQGATLAGGSAVVTTSDGVGHAFFFEWLGSTPTARESHSFALRFDNGWSLDCETNAWLAGKDPIAMSELGCTLASATREYPIEVGTATIASALDHDGNGGYSIRFDVPFTSFGDTSLELDGLVVDMSFESEACGGGVDIWPSM